MNKKLIHNYLPHINPFATEKDLKKVEELNEYEILFVFKNGDKVIYDRVLRSFRGFYPEGHELTDEEWKRSFKIRLHTIMKHRGVSQEVLAERVGTSQTMITRYINGYCIPSTIMLAKIARALNCSLDDLVYREF